MTHEILDFFYSISTWKLVFSHAFNFFRIDPDLRRLEQSPVLNYIRRVEMVYFCDMLLVKSYPSFGVDDFCAEIERRASRAIEVLFQASQLRTVIVSFIDGTNTGHFDKKAAILAPLRKLGDCNPGIRLQIGQIVGPEGDDLAVFLEAMYAELDGLVAKPAEGSTVVGDDPSPTYRLLAFDVRQQRHAISSHGGLRRTVHVPGGWSGATSSGEAHVEETVATDEHQGEDI